MYVALGLNPPLIFFYRSFGAKHLRSRFNERIGSLVVIGIFLDLSLLGFKSFCAFINFENLLAQFSKMLTGVRFAYVYS